MSFDSQDKLSMHFKNRHCDGEVDPSELYQCEICWEVSENHTKYVDHMNQHFGIPRYPKQCPLCPDEIAREFHVMRAHNDIYA